MANAEEEQQAVKLLTLTDPEFYEVEFQVLRRLEDAKGNKTIADVCREYRMDQYDFKDRWSSLLRHNTATEALRKIMAVKSHLGEPLPDIARDTEISLGTVRNIVKKLQETADGPHQRTKENMAHRMMNECGGSLKEAKAKLGKKRVAPTASTTPPPTSPPEKKKAVSTEDSQSEGQEEADSEADQKPPKEDPPPPIDEIAEVRIIIDEISCSTKAETTFLEQLLPLFDEPDRWVTEDISPDLIPPKLQVAALLQDMGLLMSCKQAGIAFMPMLQAWKAVQSNVPKANLSAFFYCVIVLSRLGYGVNVIAEAIGVHQDLVALSLMNLRLGLGPTHGRSFDVLMNLIHKEPITSARLASLCGFPRL